MRQLDVCIFVIAGVTSCIVVALFSLVTVPRRNTFEMPPDRLHIKQGMEPQSSSSFVGFRRPTTLAPDHTRIEVLRIASRTFGWEEGYSAGNPVFKHERVPYGCWFIRAPGSGIYIDVGVSLRAKTRAEASRALGISDPSYLIDDDNRNSDLLWCTYAARKGYTTIQIEWAHGRFSEIAYCAGRCTTDPIEGACLDIPTYDRFGERCHCDDLFDVLNCNDDVPKVQKHTTRYHQVDDVIRRICSKPDNRKHCQYYTCSLFEASCRPVLDTWIDSVAQGVRSPKIAKLTAEVSDPIRVWTFWLDDPPPLVSKCLQTIHQGCTNEFRHEHVSRSNMSNFLPDVHPADVDHWLKHGEAFLSDVIRILLIARYGGLYLDASTICISAFHEWFPALMARVAGPRWKSACAFVYHPDCQLTTAHVTTPENSFIFAPPSHPLILAWSAAIRAPRDTRMTIKFHPTISISYHYAYYVLQKLLADRSLRRFGGVAFDDTHFSFLGNEKLNGRYLTRAFIMDGGAHVGPLLKLTHDCRNKYHKRLTDLLSELFPK
jgi:hypothetical protein